MLCGKFEKLVVGGLTMLRVVTCAVVELRRCVSCCDRRNVRARFKKLLEAVNVGGEQFISSCYMALYYPPFSDSHTLL